MRLEVYKDNKQTDVVRLSLKDSGYGSVLLIAVDEKGGRLPASNILEITKDGTLRLMNSVNNTFGLTLDSHGRIKIKESDE